MTRLQVCLALTDSNATSHVKKCELSDLIKLDVCLFQTCIREPRRVEGGVPRLHTTNVVHSAGPQAALGAKK